MINGCLLPFLVCTISAGLFLPPLIPNHEETSLSEPGTAPRKVQVRPLSSSTMVIQWDEPETPNGQVTVGISFSNIPLRARSVSLIVTALAGIQSVLHDGLESTDGVVAVPDGG